jgi:hypothetical protein
MPLLGFSGKDTEREGLGRRPPPWLTVRERETARERETGDRRGAKALAYEYP